MNNLATHDGGAQTPLPVPFLDEVDEGSVLHYAHPRRLDKTWCGAEREVKPYDYGPKPEMERCSMCLYLLEEFGIQGWKLGLA